MVKQNRLVGYLLKNLRNGTSGCKNDTIRMCFQGTPKDCCNSKTNELANAIIEIEKN